MTHYVAIVEEEEGKAVASLEGLFRSPNAED